MYDSEIADLMYLHLLESFLSIILRERKGRNCVHEFGEITLYTMATRSCMLMENGSYWRHDIQAILSFHEVLLDLCGNYVGKCLLLSINIMVLLKCLLRNFTNLRSTKKMRSFEKYGLLLCIWSGILYAAEADETEDKYVMRNKQSFLRFEQWCIDQKEGWKFCEKESCKEALNEKRECVLVLPFDASGMSKIQQMNACNYYSPYIVSKADKVKETNSLSCTYETLTWCPDHEAVQVENRCYRPTNKASKFTSMEERRKACSGIKDGHYTVYQPTNMKERMWAAILNSNSDRKFEPFWINNGTDRMAAFSTRIDAWNDLEIGTIYEPKEDVQLKTLCVGNAVQIPHQDKMDSFLNHEEYFVTDNVYQPQLDANNKPSVQHYHEICARIFPGSVAANPNDFARSKVKEFKNVILNVAGQMDFKSNPKCNSRVPDDNNPINVRKRFKACHKNIVNATTNEFRMSGIDKTVYAPNYPGNKCADKPRTILSIHRISRLNGVVDEPEFARHPLLCIRGRSPIEDLDFEEDTEKVPIPRLAPVSAPAPRPAPVSRPAPAPSSGGGGSYGGSSSRPKEYRCPSGWRMSVRSQTTKPFCFKVFDLINGMGYSGSSDFCKVHHKARLATQEYKQDLNALINSLSNRADMFNAFLGGKNKCKTLPCPNMEFEWETIVDAEGAVGKVAFESRPLSIWNELNQDPNQRDFSQGDSPCKGIEACVIWNHADGDSWLDVLCECNGDGFKVTKIACMKEAEYDFSCEPGWEISHRNGDPFCFKAFNFETTSYDESNNYCKGKSAQLAVQESQKDHDALLNTLQGVSKFGGFLGGQNICAAGSQAPCAKPKFKWFTMDNEKTDLGKFLLWSKNPPEPNQGQWNANPSGCPKVEACIYFTKNPVLAANPFWFDVYCNCVQKTTHAFCMKKATQK